jgi:hypothetical protein
MKKIAALIALAGAATVASAQPGTVNQIAYAARAVGQTAWNFGVFGITDTTDSNPITFEIGVFCFRAQGTGLSTAVFKSYVDGVDVTQDSAAVIEDPSNGVPTSGVDGRVGVWNSGAQTQKVFTNRGAAVPGSGFRISSTADTADGSAAGGISVHQNGPAATSGGPPFVTTDGNLSFRFNLTVVDIAPGIRNFVVGNPASRINAYSSYNTLTDNTNTDFKANTSVAGLALNATWAIPAPSALALLGLGGLVAGRRRR